MQEMLMNPIVLLGQPGSGKSVLTRILAARLSAAGFLAVRVELRQAPAEADLQEQIEFAIAARRGKGFSGQSWLHRRITLRPR
jgi:predicted kinase